MRSPYELKRKLLSLRRLFLYSKWTILDFRIGVYAFNRKCLNSTSFFVTFPFNDSMGIRYLIMKIRLFRDHWGNLRFQALVWWSFAFFLYQLNVCDTTPVEEAVREIPDHHQLQYPGCTSWGRRKCPTTICCKTCFPGSRRRVNKYMRHADQDKDYPERPLQARHRTTLMRLKTPTPLFQ